MDKEIYLKLLKENHNSTISVLTIDDSNSCFVLEDGYNKVKVKGQTRIPAGRYRLKFRTEGGHHIKYKRMYPEWHRGMIELQDVPNYKYILIHIGNYVKDTDGCLLVGKSYQLNLKTGSYEVLGSTLTYAKIAHLLTDMMEDNRIFINVTR